MAARPPSSSTARRSVRGIPHPRCPTPTTTTTTEPDTLADVLDHWVYPLRSMARLVGLITDTLLAHMVATLPRRGRTSPNRVLGRTILEYIWLREARRRRALAVIFGDQPTRVCK